MVAGDACQPTAVCPLRDVVPCPPGRNRLRSMARLPSSGESAVNQALRSPAKACRFDKVKRREPE